MLIAAAATAVLLVVQSAQGPDVQYRATCITQVAQTVPCPAAPVFWLSKKVEPGPVWTAVPFKQRGSVVSFKRTDRHATYNLTVFMDGGLMSPYAIAYTEGRPWRFNP